MPKGKLLWRFRKGSESPAGVVLQCGCHYNCYDKAKLILKVCDTHLPLYNRFQTEGKMMYAKDLV